MTRLLNHRRLLADCLPLSLVTGLHRLKEAEDVAERLRRHEVGGCESVGVGV